MGEIDHRVLEGYAVASAAAPKLHSFFHLVKIKITQGQLRYISGCYGVTVKL